MFTNKDEAVLVDLSDKTFRQKRKATFSGIQESTEAQTEEREIETHELTPEPNQAEDDHVHEKHNIKEGLMKTKLHIAKANKSKENVIDEPNKNKSRTSKLNLAKTTKNDDEVTEQPKHTTPKALSSLDLEKISKKEEHQAEDHTAAGKILSKLHLKRAGKSEEKLHDDQKGTKEKTSEAVTKAEKPNSADEPKPKKVLWMTRSIAQPVNRTLFLNRTLIDICIYLVFIICVIMHSRYLRNPDVFVMHRAVKLHFTLREFRAKTTHRRLTFERVATASDVWDYLRFFTHTLGTKYLYDERTKPIRLAKGEEKKVLLQTYVLGVPRLRQLRVRNDSCQVHPLLRNIFRTCYDVYSDGNKNKFTFGRGNGTAWTYHTEAQTGSLPFEGAHGKFGGDGFYQDLYRDTRKSRKAVDELEKNFWITRETRVIFIDFALYNGNVNIFSVCKLMFFFPHLGGVIPEPSITVCLLWPRKSHTIILSSIFAALMYLLVLYYLAEWIREAVYFKWKYIQFFWTYMDALIIFTSAGLAYIQYAYVNVGKEILTNIKNYPDKYGNMEVHLSWYTTFMNINALQLYLVYMKAFKYLNFNHTMGQLNNTITKCRKDILSFSVMFFIVFCAFAELGYLLFGENTESFRDFSTSMFCLLCTILGDFDYDEIEMSSKVMAPIFFISFIFFIFFVLMNMFIAIISDSYSDVKTEMSLAPNELQMSEYIKSHALQLFRTCRLIKDVKKGKKSLVMSLSDILYVLSQCGFTDEEIEGFLLKYLSLSKEGDSTTVVLKKLEKELAQQELVMGQMFQFIKPKDYFTHQEKIDQIDNSIDECTKRLEKLLNKLERLENVKKVPKGSLF